MDDRRRSVPKRASRGKPVDPIDKAYQTALRILRARAGGLSRAELAARLEAKGHPPHAAAAAVTKLVEQRLISDKVVAESLARGTLQRGNALAAAKEALSGRGLAAKLQRSALKQAVEDDPRTDRQRALEVAKKKLTPSLRAKDAAAQRRSLFGVLARRRFDEETAREVVERLVPEADPPLDVE